MPWIEWGSAYSAKLTDPSHLWKNWSGERPTTLKFTGHERDFVARNDPGDTRYLDYMHARFYNMNMGRFLSVDPVAGVLASPQSWNLYLYARNNPVNMTDPDGRCLWDACAGEILVTAAAVTAVTAYLAAPSPMVHGMSNGQVIGESLNSSARSIVHAVSRLLKTTGCHTCGSTDPGTKSGNFVPDHQPPSALNPAGEEQKLYPHCLPCSRQQGGEVRQAKPQQQQPQPPPQPKPKTPVRK